MNLVWYNLDELFYRHTIVNSIRIFLVLPYLKERMKGRKKEGKKERKEEGRKEGYKRKKERKREREKEGGRM
jgi:uncharacterized protein YqjF (DUF2071 family)